jgi:hypothetical protein
MSKLDIALLCSNCLVLGGLMVLMALRGPSVPAVLLAIGAAGMAISKLGKAFCLSAKVDKETR